MLKQISLKGFPCLWLFTGFFLCNPLVQGLPQNRFNNSRLVPVNPSSLSYPSSNAGYGPPPYNPSNNQGEFYNNRPYPGGQPQAPNNSGFYAQGSLNYPTPNQSYQPPNNSYGSNQRPTNSGPYNPTQNATRYGGNSNNNGQYYPVHNVAPYQPQNGNGNASRPNVPGSSHIQSPYQPLNGNGYANNSNQNFGSTYHNPLDPFRPSAPSAPAGNSNLYPILPNSGYGKGAAQLAPLQPAPGQVNNHYG